MPLYLKYFQDDGVLGAWYTLLSIVNWIYIFDFGMGNSLRNKLVKAIEEKNYDKGRSYVETSYTIISIIGLTFVVVAVVIISCFNMNEILNVSAQLISSRDLKKAVIILAVGIVACFSLKTINAVLFAFQKSAATSLSTLLSSVTMLMFILLYNNTCQNTAFVVLAIVHAIAIVAPLLLTTIIVFSTRIGRQIRPRKFSLKKKTVGELLSLGGGFFVIQMMSLFVISTNEILITRFFGSACVVEYSIYHKVFNMASSICILVANPYWSKITQYITQHNFTNLKKTYRTLTLFGCVASFLIFLIVPLLQFGFNIWLKEKSIEVNYFIAIIFAVYTASYIFSIILTTVANGAGKLKTQLVFFGVAAVLKIPLIYLFKTVGFDWIAVIISVAIPMIAMCVAQHLSNCKTIKLFMKNNFQ